MHSLSRQGAAAKMPRKPHSMRVSLGHQWIKLQLYVSPFKPSNLLARVHVAPIFVGARGHGEPLLFMRFHLFSLHLAHDSSFKGNPVPSNNFRSLSKSPSHNSPSSKVSFAPPSACISTFIAWKPRECGTVPKTLTLFWFPGLIESKSTLSNPEWQLLYDTTNLISFSESFVKALLSPKCWKQETHLSETIFPIDML